MAIVFIGAAATELARVQMSMTDQRRLLFIAGLLAVLSLVATTFGCRPPVPPASPAVEPVRDDAVHTDDSPQQSDPDPIEPEALEPTGTLVPEHAGFPPRRATEAKCNQLERDASALLNELRGPCSTADDCELLASVCPFGCYQIVSRSADRKATHDALGRFFRECAVCKNKCNLPPTSLVCVNGHCADPRFIETGD